MQCPGRVCAALAACSGNWGQCWVSGLPRFPLPVPFFPRCVWRVGPSGCPLSSLAGTPSHAVRAFCGLGPVALLVFPGCPLCVCVCARAPAASAAPPFPRLVWRGHPAQSRCWVLVGPFHAVRASPRVLPRSRALSGFLEGEPVSLYLARGCALPVGWVYASGAFLRQGVGLGGGGCAPFPPTLWPEGPVGRGVTLARCVPLPSLGRPQSGCLWRRPGHGGRGPHTSLVRARLLSAGAVRWCPCVPARVCESIAVPAGAGGWGRGGRPCCGPPPGSGGPAGGGGDRPLCLWRVGGWRLRGPRVGGGVSGGVGGGGVAPWFPTSLLRGGAACGPPPSPPFVAGASLPAVCIQGRGAARGAG